MKTPLFTITAFFVCMLFLPAFMAFPGEAAMTRGQAEHLLNEAMELAGERRHTDAVQTFEAAKAGNPDAVESIYGLKIAVVLAVLGDEEKHIAHCRWLMDRYRDATIATDAERSVKGYLVAPGANDAELLAHAAKMTRLAVDVAAEAGEDELLPWFYVSHGIAEYRIANYADASKWLAKSAKDESIYIRGLALSFLALAAHQQEKHTEAEAWLEKARDTAAQLPKPGTAEYAKEWTDTLIAQLALAEANGEIAP